MCGICGVVTADPRRPADPGMLGAMTATLHNRGPDGEGYHVGEGVGLGMRRLSIVDLAGGDQPIVNEDGSLVLVCNGEIYNHVELRDRLAATGHRFRSRSDVEVILHLYEDRGVGCVDDLRGMFAFALWDTRRRRVLLARDRLGIKPLHYAVTDEGLYFGSESKAILAAGAVAPTLEAGALHEMFTFGFPLAPRTMIAGIRRLPPAHVLLYNAGRLELRRYWQCPFGEEVEGPARSPEMWAEELLACLDESVRLHLRSDVPVGAWLSGGLDSSGVVALMCRHVTGPVQTFSLGFEAPECDELRGVRTLADYPAFPLVPERALCRDEDFARLPEALWHSEDPNTTGIAVPRLVLSELAARHVKVVLTGEGADELFGGYWWYRVDRWLRPLGVLPRAVRQALLLGPVLRSRWPWASRVLLAPRRLGRARLAAMIGPPVGGQGLLAPEMGRLVAAAAAELEELDEGPAGAHPMAALQRLEMGTRLPDLVVHHVDRLSMAASLEARVPFLDHHVVALAARIPSALQQRRGEGKHMLRQALARVLPPELARRRKRGMMAPRDRWLRGPLPDFATDALSPRRLRDKGYFDAGAVGRLLAAHRAGHVSAGDVLLGVLEVQLWDDLFLHGAGRARMHAPIAAGAAS